jgi:hypothetical protein
MIREFALDWLKGEGGHPACWLRPGLRSPSLLFWWLAKPSRSYLSTCWLVSLYVNMTCGPPLVISWSPPTEIDIHQNWWNSVSVCPISMLVIAFKTFLHYHVDINMILIYPQQASQSLPFAHPWAKDKLNDGSRVVAMLSHLKSTHEFKQEFSLGLECTILTSNLLVLPSTMRLIAVTWVMSSWKIERLSQALYL